MVVTRGEPRESLNLRVPPALKRRVEEHAKLKGVAINSAGILLLDEGLRAEARRVVEHGAPSARLPATGSTSTTARPPSYGERKPYVVADSLDDLRGPVTGKVTLPAHLDWSGTPEKDLDARGGLAGVYRTVLNEAANTADLNAWLNKDALIELWPTLWLPSKIRRIWKERFPELPESTSAPS